MKYAAAILVSLLVQANAFTQDILHVKSFPINTSAFNIAAGTPLDKGWKWQHGDDAQWSLPGFNDSLWQPVNPLLDVPLSLPQIPQSSIFWLRIRFSIDSNIQQKQLALLVQQSGASAIYLDGKLIETLGHLDADADKIVAFDPIFKPILLPNSNSAVHTLAVRYALQKNVYYTTAFGATTNPLFVAKLQYAQYAIDNYQQGAMLMNGYYFFVIGLFFLLALIHSGYYFFGKAQRANLYFALYAMCYIAYVLSPLVIDTHSVYLKYYALTAGLLFIILIGPLLLTAIYDLLDVKKDWIYKAILILSALSVIIYFWKYKWGWHIGADVMSLLVQIAIIRVVLKAVYRKKKGARLLAAGAVFFLLSFSLFVLTAFLSPGNQFLINLLFAIAVLSIPLATSVYLGFEFGFLNLSLKQKLTEVSELSRKNLAQEKEQQQLLAHQNETLEKQVVERTLALTQSLNELKATQAQLVQSEKMASLGELTAGIAHEIQNPLNFVNNFSEVNAELIAEMKDALAKGDMEEARAIADDILQNSAKINHHGKRADAIVKGMLQHSRSSSAVKEPTDINKLADEYLRLAYHGLRAKDKSFNAVLKTGYDESIGRLNINPQDIGRVILNLITNAFYATSEKTKAGRAGYEPTVAVSTKKQGDNIFISVKDNGNGIPQKIQDKIFQPFFTTKPTGQGTGLGLSLSYDIIKAHGGEISLFSEEGKFTEFVIILPL